MVWCRQCCCCHLKGGAIAIGVVFLVLNGLGIISSATTLGVSNSLLRNQNSSGVDAVRDVINAIAGTSLAMYVISSITSIMLFIPACCNDDKAQPKRFFLIPFMVWMVIYMVICVGFAIYYVAVVGIRTGIFAFGVYIIFIALGIYCEIMIYSYFQHLRDFDPTKQQNQGGAVVMQVQPPAVGYAQTYAPGAYPPQAYPPQGQPIQGQPMMMQGQPMMMQGQPMMMQGQPMPMGQPMAMGEAPPPMYQEKPPMA